MLDRHGQRQARKRVAAVAETLFSSVSMPVPVTVETVCAALAAHRGRAIRLIPMSTLDLRQPPFSGLWLAGEETDYIFFDNGLPMMAWQNAVRHELGHMLLGHRSSGALSDLMVILMRQVVPKASPSELRSTMQAPLCRMSGVAVLDDDDADPLRRGDPRHELEAELLAAELWKQWWRDPAPRPNAAPTSTPDDSVLCRFAGAMDYGPGRPADPTR
ncbi:hypothetical protein [Amycolatopsis sp. WGS_07]|uniref:hypothetical protein n=1 Tax=Amycolatopsis sp. WGS_07 TaxID=3076764 RepID=UPI00387329B1